MSRCASEPLRALSEEEQKELQRVSRASSEPRIRHQRTVALLAVAEGKSLSQAARLVGWKGHDPVTKVTRRFNRMGLAALDDLPRPGPHRKYGAVQRARILQEARRTPDRKEDATATWSLSLLQRALRGNMTLWLKGCGLYDRKSTESSKVAFLPPSHSAPHRLSPCETVEIHGFVGSGGLGHKPVSYTLYDLSRIAEPTSLRRPPTQKWTVSIRLPFLAFPNFQAS